MTKQTKATLITQLAFANDAVKDQEVEIQQLKEKIKTLESAVPPAQLVIPPPLFAVGDPVIHNSRVDFIMQSKWSEDLNTWRYIVHLTQESACSLDQWQGGGSVSWISEHELAKPVGIQKLWGELWRELRLTENLKQQIKASIQRQDSLKYALTLIIDKP